MKIGKSWIGKDIHLTADDLRTHVYGAGKSQRGKSRFIALLARELIKQGKGVCLIDPHGNFRESSYEGVLNWLAYVRPRFMTVNLLDPSVSPAGFNPFKLQGEKTESRIMTKVDRLVDATLKVWDSTSSTGTPWIDRWLRCFFYLLVEQDLPLGIAQRIRDESFRAPLIQRIQSYVIREEWQQLNNQAQLESTLGRLFKLINHPTVRRTLAGSLDLDRITRGEVLLCNLGETDELSQEAGRVVGTLLVSEIAGIFRRGKRPDFYLIVDEVQLFATPDMPVILRELAKYGLHLIAFNQYPDDLDKELRRAFGNTDAKVFFGGVSVPELKAMMVEDPELAHKLPRRHFTLIHQGSQEWGETVDVKFDYPADVQGYIREHTPPPEPEPIFEPPAPSQERVELPAPPMPQTNREIAEWLLSTYKTFSSHQIPYLTDRSKKDIQLVLNDLAGEGKCWKTNIGRLNVYCEKENKFYQHDLLRTDFLIANRDRLTRIVLSGIRDGINPDGYLESGNLCFFLEVERSNPRSDQGESEWLGKAREYDRYALEHRHKRLCENFRVIFVLPTKAKAEGLAAKIRQAVPNPARFWLTYTGNYTQFTAADGATHALPIVDPPTDS